MNEALLQRGGYMDKRVSSLQLEKPWLPQEVLDSAMANTVLCTVDFIICNGTEGKFLLITRTGGDHWSEVQWFFGGRQRRGETEMAALERLAMDEAGIADITQHSVVFSHNQDVYNPGSAPGSNRSFGPHHSKMAVHIVFVDSSFVPKLNKKCRDPVWYGRTDYPRNLPEPVLVSLSKAGLIE